MKTRKIFPVLSVLLFCFFLFPSVCASASPTAANVSLTVKQNFETKNAGKETDLTGTYELYALDKNSPMPEQSEKDAYTFSLEGKQAETSLSFSYPTAGTYRYRLQQITADKEFYSYDKSLYDITVSIKKGQAGQLLAQVIVKNADGKKCGEICFNNSYRGKTTETFQETTPGTPGGQGSYGQSAPVKTGDGTDIWFYLIAGAGAFSVIAILLSCKKRRTM